MPVIPSWQTRVNVARRAGGFTPEDRDLSGSWESCRVGEIALECAIQQHDGHATEAILDGVRSSFEQAKIWSLCTLRDTDAVIAVAQKQQNADLLMSALATLGYAFHLAVSRDDFDAAQKFHDALGNVL